MNVPHVKITKIIIMHCLRGSQKPPIMRIGCKFSVHVDV